MTISKCDISGNRCEAVTHEQRELVERLRNSSNSMRHDAADLIKQIAAERDDLLDRLIAWKVRYQDEVNARVNAENDLYAMSQERRREHDLRVKINNEAETLRDAHRIAVDRHSVTLNELTAARSALTAERTRREALEARIGELEACVMKGVYG